MAWALAGMATTAFECGLPWPWETHDATANCIDLWAMNSSLVITRALLEMANILMASAYIPVRQRE
ncbi:hypothetical protein BTJ68_14789 [Hortaea werneckii EXF-2000]|uniref:Uncharacterized protein n=1 Tax=Hortaea werneckii EXF-2000 TaxID=1157616 RepID=A0A1Z5SND6_HORWE|nr:hypothetical protein BTJ68_14789 [Hortaea werneckii EXF-2000]